MKLLKSEKETVILFNESDERAIIQTYNAGLMKRLLSYSERYPELCREERQLQQGGIIFSVSKKRLSIHLIPPCSLERRKRASKRLKVIRSK